MDATRSVQITRHYPDEDDVYRSHSCSILGALGRVRVSFEVCCQWALLSVQIIRHYSDEDDIYTCIAQSLHAIIVACSVRSVG